MDTIAYFGHHKCASTYIMSVLRGVAQFLGLRLCSEYVSSRLPLGYEKKPEQADRIKKAYQRLATASYDVLGHGNADNAVVATLENRGPFRGFHVIRDPRDLLISGYFWHTSENSIDKNPANEWNVERRQRLQGMPNKEMGLLQELEFSSCYLAAMAAWNYQQRNILEMRYEEMAGNPRIFFTSAFSFCGLPLVKQSRASMQRILLNQLTLRIFGRPVLRVHQLPERILEHILESRAFSQQTNGRPCGTEAPEHKYRKGSPGDWRNHFTPRITGAFKERYGHILEQLDYEENEHWSIERKSL
ncbi:MAG TPA: hypothetical protein DCS43_09900 [Verrucomicrobia bacterium]|nr:hypothetical protein [Verrucomicrobiota bacterium]